ncbi:hypothetical protein TNCV_3358181 [Trichonephila clavipes]|nr:hypothetical protein TNCV_3358181 [Trichonephila clavipes]
MARWGEISVTRYQLRLGINKESTCCQVGFVGSYNHIIGLDSESGLVCSRTSTFSDRAMTSGAPWAICTVTFMTAFLQCSLETFNNSRMPHDKTGGAFKGPFRRVLILGAAS